MGRSKRNKKRRDEISKRSLPFDNFQRSKPISSLSTAQISQLSSLEYHLLPTLPVVRPKIVRRPNVNRSAARPAAQSASLHTTQRIVQPSLAAAPASVCQQREQRKQVLFAQGHTGRGSRPGKWTTKSYKDCK